MLAAGRRQAHYAPENVIEIQELERAAGDAGRRVRIGTYMTGVSLALVAISAIFLDKAIMMLVVMALAVAGTMAGASLILDGAVRRAGALREIRARRQLPAARIVER